MQQSQHPKLHMHIRNTFESLFQATLKFELDKKVALGCDIIATGFAFVVLAGLVIVAAANTFYNP